MKVLVAQLCPALQFHRLARQAPLSMEFPRQGYWNGLQYPLTDLPDPQGLNPGLSHCRQMMVSATRKALYVLGNQ